MADIWEKPYEKAFEVQNKPAAHGILNGIIYTPKKSYETISNLAAIFGGDISPTRTYIHIDTTGESVTELLSCQTMTFCKNNTPVYAYYLPLQLGKEHNITYTAQISVADSINDPILIDPYTGEVFDINSENITGEVIENGENFTGMTSYKNLPLNDYPLVLAERSAFDILPLG